MLVSLYYVALTFMSMFFEVCWIICGCTLNQEFPSNILYFVFILWQTRFYFFQEIFKKSNKQASISVLLYTECFVKQKSLHHIHHKCKKKKYEKKMIRLLKQGNGIHELKAKNRHEQTQMELITII